MYKTIYINENIVDKLDPILTQGVIWGGLSGLGSHILNTPKPHEKHLYSKEQLKKINKTNLINALTGFAAGALGAAIPSVSSVLKDK